MSEVSMENQAELGRIQPKVEQKPTVAADTFVKSADSTYLYRLKKLLPGNS